MRKYTVSETEPGDLCVDNKMQNDKYLLFVFEEKTVLIVSILTLRFRKLRNLLQFYLIPDARTSVSDFVKYRHEQQQKKQATVFILGSSSHEPFYHDFEKYKTFP